MSQLPTALMPGNDPRPAETFGASADLAADLLHRQQLAGPTALWCRVCRVDRTRVNALTALAEPVTFDPHHADLAVGDWCIVRRTRDVLDLVWVAVRHSELTRREAGQSTRAHVLAVNVDVVLVVLPMDRALSRRTLERMLAAAWEGGASPVVVLSKTDVAAAADVAGAIALTRSAAADVPVLAVSTTTHDGIEALRDALRGLTAVLLGSSGAGKSTLANELTGCDARTGEVRESDAKGRHTTTWRELMPMPGGGALIDTPGLRGFGLWVGADGIATTFADVTDAAAACRFADCDHRGEPDCAVADAIAAGTLDEERLESWRKLQKEAAYVARRHDQRLTQQEKKMWIQRSRAARGRHRP